MSVQSSKLISDFTFTAYTSAAAMILLGCSCFSYMRPVHPRPLLIYLPREKLMYILLGKIRLLFFCDKKLFGLDSHGQVYRYIMLRLKQTKQKQQKIPSKLQAKVGKPTQLQPNYLQKSYWSLSTSQSFSCESVLCKTRPCSLSLSQTSLFFLFPSTDLSMDSVQLNCLTLCLMEGKRR